MLQPYAPAIKNYYSAIGIDTPKPIFVWKLSSPLRNQKQTHYRITVAENAESLEEENNLLWDSGKVASDEQLGVMYKGSPLESTSRYCWRVAIWDSSGQSLWSEVQYFITGYLNSEHWSAKWIGDGSDAPFYARYEFDLNKKVKQAFALVSGLGQFKFYMNGRQVGDHEMDPGWTNYHKSVQYVGFDITDHLQSGKNAVGLHVGNGFFAGASGGRHFYTMDKGYEPYGDQLVAIGEWHIEFEDGSRIILRTGEEGWKVHESATTLANVYGSENFDARLYPDGYHVPGFDDSGWKPAQLLKPPAGNLVQQNQPPVKVKQVYDTLSVAEPLPGVYVFDLGQNMAGMFEIYASGPAGSKVIIKPGELMREDGTIATPWDIVTYSEFILAGTGEVEVWKPDFSYYGARWVQIEGCTRDEADTGRPMIHDVKGHFITSASQDTGTLSTDDVRIDKLADIITKAIESNLQSVHTDCPTIEKLGWLEASALMGPSIVYVKQAEELFLKIVRDMMEAQTEEGLIPDIAPEYSLFPDGFRDSIAWGIALLMVPDLLLERYNNFTAIEVAYPAMKRYMDYLKSKEIHDGLIGHGLGDWGIQPQTGGDYIENVETAFYYEGYRLMAKFAGILGFTDELEDYSAEAERIKLNYNKQLLHSLPENSPRYAYCKLGGQFDPANQVVQAIPLAFNLVPEEQLHNVEHALLQAVASRQFHSGEIGLRYLFLALSRLNRNDIVLDMMMQPEHPSYIRFVERGETSLPEFWTDEARSRNHDMMGHILEWLYKELLGISSASGAYKEILIAPFRSGRVKRVKGVHHSIRGEIGVEFSHSAEEIILNVQIPANTTATLQIPLLHGESQLYERGTRVLYEPFNQGAQIYARLKIGSGSYSYVNRV
ncbi:family 78 glycoside hydrolase catalytic domain [Paenibacillus sp. FSL R7-0331]|uniref:family 78 glycoside hydrolase catalytic domain n=1 Tax=Paenibacillus sp. FSL R7-0331 TaxID=1536773 RepID=UPI0004F6D660|nr:family 78 glycoside hydrolase catalytic domain [Paenibacillus sp. FSL R7-0331]AIQ51389.1 hypothetical protein R70331_07590 [Paenibacillus sp. FSL R7-0331]